MKSFKEAAGEDLAEKSELCQCMESVIGKCKKRLISVVKSQHGRIEKLYKGVYCKSF